MPAAVRMVRSVGDRRRTGEACQPTGRGDHRVGGHLGRQLEPTDRAEHGARHLIGREGRGRRVDGRQGTGEQPVPFLQGRAQGVPVRRGEQADIQSQTGDPRRGQQVDGSAGRTAVHDHRGLAQPLDQAAVRRADLGDVHGAMPTEPTGGGDVAAQHGRQRRLVELQDQLLSRQPSRQFRDQLDDPLLQRLDDLAAGTGVGKHPVPARVLEPAASVQGPATAILRRPFVALGDLLQLVEIGPQGGDGAAMVAGRDVGQPPARGLQIDAESGQHRGAATDQPGVRTSGRKFRQVREIRAFCEGDLERVRQVGAGPGTDAGGDDAVGRDHESPLLIMMRWSRRWWRCRRPGTRGS